MFKPHYKSFLFKTGIFIVILLFGWILFHNTTRYFESKRLSGKHEYIEIDGKKIHCWTGGKGKHTIILLSGFGTPSPILDFKPLTKELTKKHRVVIIENFGYGYSDDTDKPRTLENMDDEIHVALNKLNIKSPYSLLVHSISGILAHYLIAKHSNEIEAMIGIDPAVPEYFEDDITIPGYTYKESLIHFFGLVRLASIIAPNFITPSEMKTYYPKEDLKEIRKLAIRNYFNKAQTDEFSRFYNNGELTLSLDKNLELPVLYFLAKSDTPDSKWKKLRQKNIELYPKGLSVELEGSHYLHHTKSVEISAKINQFLKQHLKNN